MALVTRTVSINPAFLQEIKEDHHELRQLMHHAAAMLNRPGWMRVEYGRLFDLFEKMRDQLEGREYVEEYVQTLTHELKSPVAAIRGAAELLAEDPPAAQRQKFLTNIGQETHRLQDLIDRLLELSSLEKRKGLDDQKEVNLGSIASGAVDHLMPMLQRRGLHIESKIEPEVMIRGDAFLLEVALMNLLQNACEFSPQGGLLRLSVKRGLDSIQFTLEDEGPGLPEFAVERVFDRFYSLPRPSTGHKSSGLGLCFVREIALLHHGSVRLENRPAGGAIATSRKSI